MDYVRSLFGYKTETPAPTATTTSAPVGMANSEQKSDEVNSSTVGARRRKTRRGKKRGSKRGRTGKRSNRS